MIPFVSSTIAMSFNLPRLVLRLSQENLTSESIIIGGLRDEWHEASSTHGDALRSFRTSSLQVFFK
jgi:hypothetical protein